MSKKFSIAYFEFASAYVESIRNMEIRYFPHNRLSFAPTNDELHLSEVTFDQFMQHYKGSNANEDGLNYGSVSHHHSEAANHIYPNECYLMRTNEYRNTAKRRKPIDKSSEEYRLQRERNNIAVRRSREKAKQRCKEFENKLFALEKENEQLKHKIDMLNKEIDHLRMLLSRKNAQAEMMEKDASKGKKVYLCNRVEVENMM